MDRVANKLLAQQSKQLDPFQGIGPLGNSSSFLNISSATSLLARVISLVISVITIVSFIWFIFNLFIGAFAWLSSGGDKAKLQEAQKKILNSLVGLILVISAIFLIKIVGTILGFDILNIGQFINQLQ